MTTKHRMFITVVLILLAGCNPAKDEHEALEAASRINSQFSSGDFTSIHREAAQHFKVRDERTFISLMEQMRKEYGVMQKAKALAYQTTIDSSVGRTHVIVSDLEFEKARARERIILTRTADGQMRLWELLIEPSP